MIVPEIAAGAAAELAPLRAACDAALGRLAASGARTLMVVGGDESDRRYSFPFRGSFAPWGVPVDVHLGPTDPALHSGPTGPAGPAHDSGPTGRVAGDEELPLSLLVGAWLLRRAFRPAGPVTYRMETVGWETAPAECATRGARAGSGQPWALLVLGDGSICRGEKSPGYHDPGAEPYDDAVAAALRGADAQALLDLDPEESARLGVAGRAPWQLLAGAVRAAGGRWRGDLSYYAAPYGVAYFVANWDLLDREARP
ncbi:class III extradiol dioxygenase subunit B-like domain-containing protein [Micromonospora sp. NPDC049559]|uniref:class III extradiol dioxygenase subunit B-like domain-containing protein n=1 Tax=Micromonospora sp. NPDC049559 TaxID=3155923 RepID=UPI0034303661